MTRILVLEDDARVREVWLDFLSDLGDFRVASCAREAELILGEGFTPDIIFSDWEMPGATGGEYCAELRARGVDTPVVIVSGLDRSRELRACGANEYLSKPCLRKHVERAIERWTQSR